MMLEDLGERQNRVRCLDLPVCISWRIRATRARVVHEREYIRKSYQQPHPLSSTRGLFCLTACSFPFCSTGDIGVIDTRRRLREE